MDSAPLFMTKCRRMAMVTLIPFPEGRWEGHYGSPILLPGSRGVWSWPSHLHFPRGEEEEAMAICPPSFWELYSALLRRVWSWPPPIPLLEGKNITPRRKVGR